MSWVHHWVQVVQPEVIICGSCLFFCFCTVNSAFPPTTTCLTGEEKQWCPVFKKWQLCTETPLSCDLSVVRKCKQSTPIHPCPSAISSLSTKQLDSLRSWGLELTGMWALAVGKSQRSRFKVLQRLCWAGSSLLSASCGSKSLPSLPVETQVTFGS